jgi:hypothetical protein
LGFAEAHDESIHRTAVITGQHAQRNAERHAGTIADESDEECQASASNHVGEQIAT